MSTLFSNIRNKVSTAITWRKKYWRHYFYHRLGGFGGKTFVCLRWPWPLRKPYQKKQLALTPPGNGIGDSLMCTPVFRAIKRHNPECQITFLTQFPELFAGNQYLDCVKSPTDPAAASAICLGYSHMIPDLVTPRNEPLPVVTVDSKRLSKKEMYRGYDWSTTPTRPLITLMAECVGLILHDIKLDCAQMTPRSGLQQQLSAIPDPKIVIQTCSSKWTPNKNWPAAHWKSLVEQLTGQFSVVEVGTDSSFSDDYRPARFYSFVKRTSISEFAYIISTANLFIGPVSSGMHIANAYNIPAVIIYGGYESPQGYNPRSRTFYTQMECAPCWLITPCPYQHECLTKITPEQVLQAVITEIKNKSTP